jgi:hypothetical protein
MSSFLSVERKIPDDLETAPVVVQWEEGRENPRAAHVRN